MPLTEPRRNPEEVARMGVDLYDRQVRPKLQSDDDGKFVALDIKTGEFELNQDDYQAVARLRSRCPSAEVWLGRVGEPAAYRMRRGR